MIHDNPGVLAAIAAKFAEHGVSINGVNQDLKPTLKDPATTANCSSCALSRT